MEIVGLLVLLVIGGAYTWYSWRTADEEVEEALEELRRSFPESPPTPPVESWLSRQLLRDERYRSVGGWWGLFLGLLVDGTDAESPLWAIPLDFLPSAVCCVCGVVLGSLVAALRSAPFRDGTVRTVSPRRRTVREYVRTPGVAALWFAPLLVGGALALLVSRPAAAAVEDGAESMVVVTSLAALVCLAAPLACRTMVARPLGSSSEEGILWQRRLTERLTVDVALKVFLLAVFTAWVATYASLVTTADGAEVVDGSRTGPIVLGVASILAIGCIGALARRARADRAAVPATVDAWSRP